MPATSTVGGGSLPGETLPTRLVVLETGGARSAAAAAGRLAARLRTGEPPVVARVAEGQLLLDLRTVPPRMDEVVLYTILRLGRGGHGPAAMINAESEAIVAVGAIIADIPMVDRIDISLIRDGDWVVVDDGSVMVTQ